MRLSKITGSSPTSTSASDGSAASPSRSSRASWYATTASVSLLKGRSTSVAGSYFITSTNTKRPAAAVERLSSGQCTRPSKAMSLLPSMRAESSKLGGIRA